MPENDLKLISVLENGFDWKNQMETSLLVSDADGGIILLPYELSVDETDDFGKQSACISYVESISVPNKIFFITTSKWASTIIPLIHHYKQIDCILILLDTEEYPEYEPNYFKIIGIYDDEKQLIDSIHEQIILEKQQHLSFAFYNQHQKSVRDLSKESASFLWLLLFKDIIIRMQAENTHEQAKQELVEQLKRTYRNNRIQLKLIEHFNETYRTTDNEPLRWYTSKPFLHKQINRALRTEDIQMLHTFRFIISDISCCLKQEFELMKEYTDDIVLYRGLQVSNEELDRLKKNLGKIISTNGFLSTSRSRSVALMFAGKSKENKQSVLFEIECNVNELKNDSLIFADISRFSEIRYEDEILFDIGATFIMETIAYDNESNVWLIKLKGTDEAAEIGQFYLERNKQFVETTSVTQTFGILLYLMGQYSEALDYFLLLLDNNSEDQALILFSIGVVLFELGKYTEALEYLENAREIFQLRQPPQFSCELCAHIGYIFSRMGNYEQALKIHTECLTFAEKQTKYDPYLVAVCLSRIGNVYLDQCQYDLAMNYYMKSNHFLSTCCSSDHIEHGKNLANIGSAYYFQGNVEQALTYYEQALKILEKYLVPKHKLIATVLNNLGNIRRDQGDHIEALKYFHQCLSVELQLFPEGHLDIASTYNQIGQLLCLEENYDECLENYFKALQIQTEICDENHIDCAMTLYNIAYAYAKIGKELDKAMNYAQQTLRIIEHNQLMTSRTAGKCLLLVGNILHLQSNDNQALENISNAMNILKNVYNSQQHPDIALGLTELGDIYLSLNMLNRALQSHKEALEIRQHFAPMHTSNCKNYLPSHYKDVADSLTNIAHVYSKMNETYLALNFCWKSLVVKKIYYPSTKYKELMEEMKSIAYSLSCLEIWDDALTCYLQIDTMIVTDEEKTLNLSNIGQCYRAKQNYSTALDYYQQALTIASIMNQANSNANIIIEAINHDIFEMVCECVLQVYIKHGYHFNLQTNSTDK